MRLAGTAFIAALAVAVAVPAWAQVNPFRTSSGREMPAGDRQALMTSIQALNNQPHLKVGAKDEWHNPKTGGSGSNTVQRIFTSGGMPCHTLLHRMADKAGATAHSYTLTWCKTAQGVWKSKG